MSDEETRSDSVRVTVSGSTYYACLDPGCSEFHREHPEISAPAFKRKGKGWQADYGNLDLTQWIRFCTT